MKLVPNAISTQIARQALQGRKSAPGLLFATGVAGMVGSTVLACRSTLKLEEVIDGTREKIDLAKRIRDPEDDLGKPRDTATGKIVEDLPKDYSENDYRRDMVVIYTRGAVNIVKLYAPSIMLGAFSIGCLTKSHNILASRNAALTAAYVAVDEAFSKYRGRVVKKYGEEQDREFRHSTEEVDMVDENGRMSKERVFSDEEPSMYARFFDEYSSNWSKAPDYNLVFLRCQQQWANDMLKTRGHVFLNEVYDSLGLDRTTAGSVVGWVISHEGDNHIDFGIFTDPTGVATRDFINGRNGSILLDFNVDGVIYDKIDGHKERLKWQS